MIEISHRQARVLIREGIDRPLPDEQWSALQAHLESCAECRAYQHACSSTEKDLRRVLLHRWAAAYGPVGSVWQALVRRGKTRARAREWLKRGLIGAGIVALLFLWTIWQRNKSMEVERAAAKIHPAPTPTQALTFRGVVAYPAMREGRTRTVLLTAGGGTQPIMTTDFLPGGKQNEYSPAWSPDGEWLAFLQDAPFTGKTEVYVIHVSGTRLTALSSNPDIAWSGPLSWSSDGKYIALIGKRIRQGGSSWIYLAALDGSGVKALPGTRNVLGAPRFSLGLPMLAFSDSYANLHVYNTESGFHGLVNANNQPDLAPFTGQELNYDWSPGGHALVYLAHTENGLQLRLSPDIDPVYRTDLTGGTEIEALMDPTILRSVSWVPNNLLVATLYRENQNCWIVRLNNSYRLDQMARNLTGLCIAGHIGPEHWTSDGNWLVAWARTPEEVRAGKAPAPYALRIPDDIAQATSTYFEKLADLPIPASGLLPELAVRPRDVQSMGLSPRPAAPYQAPPTPAHPAEAVGQLVYTLTGRDLRPSLMAAQPDGTDNHALVQENTASFCPAVSPDKRKLAYVAIDPSISLDTQPGNTLQSVVLADADGTNPRVLFDLRTAPEASSSGVYRPFGCPVWSPDGKWVAAVLHDGPESSLALAPAEPPAAEAAKQPEGQGVILPRYYPIGYVSSLMLPTWTPDSLRILLVYPDNSGSGRPKVRLAALDPFDPAAANAQAAIKDLKTFDGWSDIGGLAFSPDGSEAAIIWVFDSSSLSARSSFSQLAVVRSDRWDIVSAPSYDIATSGTSTLHWLADGRVTFVTQTSPSEPNRAYLLVYDPRTLRTDTLLAFGDIMINTAWTQDDRWVAFTSESGLWVLNAGDVLLGQPASPLLVNNDATWQVAWK